MVTSFALLVALSAVAAQAGEAVVGDEPGDEALADVVEAGGESGGEPDAPPAEPPLQRCRLAGSAGDHGAALAACTEAVAEGGLSVEEWIDAERLATRAHFALGQRQEGEARLFSILVLDPSFTLRDDAPEAMKTAFGPTARRLLREGRLEVEHRAPASLTAMRHEPLTFTISDPLARIGEAEVLFEFVDANETKGFAQVPLTRRSLPDGRSSWTGRAPDMAWPPRIVRYQLQLSSPARTAIELEMGPTTLKPSAELLAEEEKRRADRARIEREAKTAAALQQEDEDDAFPVALAVASTFTALTFGTMVVGVALFGTVVVGNALANNLVLSLTGEQRSTLAWISALSGLAGLATIPAALLLGAVSVGLWSFYAVSDAE
jgi:hypothetical protein